MKRHPKRLKLVPAHPVPSWLKALRWMQKQPKYDVYAELRDGSILKLGTATELVIINKPNPQHAPVREALSEITWQATFQPPKQNS